jgi:hypothetical protein
MTEDEAKTKWCPHVRVVITGNGQQIGPANRAVGANGMEGTQGARCIASGCMSWRLRQQTFSRDLELWSKSRGVRVISAWGDDADWRPIGGDSDPPPATGYCGLAGPIT